MVFIISSKVCPCGCNGNCTKYVSQIKTDSCTFKIISAVCYSCPKKVAETCWKQARATCKQGNLFYELNKYIDEEPAGGNALVIIPASLTIWTGILIRLNCPLKDSCGDVMFNQGSRQLINRIAEQPAWSNVENDLSCFFIILVVFTSYALWT